MGHFRSLILCFCTTDSKIDKTRQSHKRQISQRLQLYWFYKYIELHLQWCILKLQKSYKK